MASVAKLGRQDLLGGSADSFDWKVSIQTLNHDGYIAIG